MESAMAAGAPGEHHEHLALMVGTWDYDLKMWMPGAPEAMELKGTMVAESILGGRFIQSAWSGDFMGAPFMGIGIDGYDNNENKYTSSWRDNFGTYTLTYSGSCADGGKTRTMTSTFMDPMMGVEVSERGVTKVNADGTVLMTSYRTMPGNDEMKSMEILLKRR